MIGVIISDFVEIEYIYEERGSCWAIVQLLKNQYLSYLLNLDIYTLFIHPIG